MENFDFNAFRDEDGVLDGNGVVETLGEAITTLAYAKNEAQSLGPNIMNAAIGVKQTSAWAEKNGIINKNNDNPLINQGVYCLELLEKSEEQICGIAQAMSEMYNVPGDIYERGSDFYHSTMGLINHCKVENIDDFGEVPDEILFIMSILFMVNEHYKIIGTELYLYEEFVKLRDYLVLWLIDNKRVKRTIFGAKLVKK